jgi:uncharacterized protein (TIGR00730 family)
MKQDEQDPSSLIAFEDLAFLKRDELRPMRLMLELMKPELYLREAGIDGTIVVFGSARILEKTEAQTRLDAATALRDERPDNPAYEAGFRAAERMVENAVYYDVAREFGRIVSGSVEVEGKNRYVVVTGGGPGIMEAANRGAHDLGAKTVGLNITLPHEQRPNPFLTPGLDFNFHYFAIRKMHFMLRAKALVAFPGGFGTLDELFEALTLVQTGKVRHLPVVLVGRAFWERAINVPFLVDSGFIAPEDVSLFRYAETASEAWQHIVEYHAKHGTV